MSICPFLSNRGNHNDGFQNLHPCVTGCELLTSNGCALKVLAKAQYQISKNATLQNNKQQ